VRKTVCSANVAFIRVEVRIDITAVTVKIISMLYSLVYSNQCFVGTWCLHLKAGGSTFFRNIGTYLPNYTASYLRK